VSDVGASGMMSMHCSYGVKWQNVGKCMRFRTLFLCVSINFFRAFLSRLLIDALRFCNTADAVASPA